MKPEKPKGDEAWERLEYMRKKRTSMGGLAQLASEGDHEAAMSMLRYAAHHVWESNMPDPLRFYLADCFERAVIERSTEFAFNLKLKDGSGHTPDAFRREFRDSQIARAAEHYHSKGYSYAEAYRLIAKEEKLFGQDKKLGVVSIKKIHRRFYPATEKDN